MKLVKAAAKQLQPAANVAPKTVNPMDLPMGHKITITIDKPSFEHKPEPRPDVLEPAKRMFRKLTGKDKKK